MVHVFLTSALAGGEWLASSPSHFNPDTSLDMRLGGPQSRSGRRGEEKIVDPTGTRTPTSSVMQPVSSRYSD
jgi:hypothetical protein